MKEEVYVERLKDAKKKNKAMNFVLFLGLFGLLTAVFFVYMFALKV